MGAAPGNAQNFLDRANRLKAKGLLALFDSDYGRLKAEATGGQPVVGDDRRAAERAGRPTPIARRRPARSSVHFEFVDGLEAIPAPNARE